jgi:hypothetical protein
LGKPIPIGSSTMARRKQALAALGLMNDQAVID